MDIKLGFVRPLRVTPVIEWRDLWVGVFVDAKRGMVYVLPMPCLGVRVQWARRVRCHRPGCGRDAEMRCVKHDGDAELRGTKFIDFSGGIRDPLCGHCGALGDCPDTRQDKPPYKQWHMALTERTWWEW